MTADRRVSQATGQRRITITRAALVASAAALPFAVGGGCVLSGIGSVLGTQVQVFNDTAFDVQPNIKFDNDTNFLAELFPADDLGTGLVAPGEVLTFNFDCDALGSIGSDDAEQVIPLFSDAEASDTDVLKRGDQFDCGDLIEFRFVGEGDDFAVIVSVNGRVVD